MSIIKLNAIDSTNDFLKEMVRNQSVENFTTVVANSQLKGRGQMGTKWQSEEGKNLVMSTLIKDLELFIDDVFVLNCMISVAVVEALKEVNIPKLSIKWPNDIMSDTKKIAGILIENSIKPDSTFASVVGLGLNVNQEQFIDLPNASSLKLQTGREFDLDDILQKILYQFNYYFQFIVEKKQEILWQMYHDYLFKRQIPVVFQDVNENQFMGIISKVNQRGMLEVLLEDDSIQLFTIKEIKMIY